MIELKKLFIYFFILFKKKRKETRNNLSEDLN